MHAKRRIAFVFLYDVNFSYSWAPIGWGEWRISHFPSFQDFKFLRQLSPVRFSRCICGPRVSPLRHRSPGSRTCARCYHHVCFFLILICCSVVGLVSPSMLATSKGGLAYYTFAGFSLLALLSASTSSPCIVSKTYLARSQCSSTQRPRVG